MILYSNCFFQFYIFTASSGIKVLCHSGFMSIPLLICSVFTEVPYEGRFIRTGSSCVTLKGY